MHEFEPKGVGIPTEDWCPTAAVSDLRYERRQFASVALAISLITLLATVVQIVAITLISVFCPWVIERDWYVVVFSTLPMYAVSMPLSIFFYRIGKGVPPPQKRRITPLALCGLLCICFALSYVGNIFGAVINAIIGVITGEPPVNDLQEMTLNTPFWANLLFCGILAPIMEEIFYRKLVIDRLRRYGDLFAVLASGILFGLIHGNFYQFFYAAMIGCLFGYLYLYSGRLRYTVALHMGFNLIGGVYSTEVLKRLDLEAFGADPIAYFASAPLPVAMYLFYLAFTGLCMLLSPVALALLWKHIRFSKGEVRLTASQLAKAMLINPATWLMVVVILMMFLL